MCVVCVYVRMKEREKERWTKRERRKRREVFERGERRVFGK